MRFLLIGLMVTLTACASVAHHAIDVTTIHDDTLVTCHSKVEKKDLVYIGSMRHDFQSKVFPQLTLSNIIDIDDKPWTINSMEMTQFACTEKQLP